VTQSEQVEARRIAERYLDGTFAPDAKALARAYLALQAELDQAQGDVRDLMAFTSKLEAELDRIRTDRNILSKSNADLLAELEQAREREKNYKAALREMLGSYEAIARMLEAGDSRPFKETMKWDGPVCARRALGVSNG